MYIGIYNLILSDIRFAAETQFPSPGISGKTFELPLHNSSILAKGPGISESMGFYLKMIFDNGDSRQIFYFLLLNMTYMFVQIIYGIWTNSLGLISDAIHMFFDCVALAFGLFASIMSKWPENNSYGRIETLSGFANGIFLILVSVFIMFEAMGRLFEPPEMNTDKLLLVSFVGLIVNLVGIFAFNHGHHGHSHGSNNGNGHVPSKSRGNLHGHYHDNHHHGHHHHDHGDNANMEGF
ncbi:9154_t:CDS:2 [Acaulospora colombiana]|uniref:9154_t:CDS:1 n=1 Tax=Acaulospora colombiana TaxID=27376 RepID=A0ACA9NQD5_9GLOM|nr:9154_t:CDS:2 [Acaulospora colombiana]